MPSSSTRSNGHDHEAADALWTIGITGGLGIAAVPPVQADRRARLVLLDQRPRDDVARRVGAGGAVLASFSRPENAAVALEKLLDAGFINVEQEVEGRRTVIIVDAGDRQAQAREIIAEHGGTEFDPPN